MKYETRFFRQTREEMKAVLIVFFRLFLVSVELNEWMKTLSFAKTSSFFKPIKSFVPFKGFYVPVIMIVKLSKGIRLIGVCVETESARAIRAQTAPMVWLIP